MDLVFFGIQGSGKGTQAKKLAAEFGYDIFEAGGELRKIAASGTPLGDTVKSFIDVGKLVPFEIIMKVVETAIRARPASQKILFDGIPRDADQKREFDRIMKAAHRDFRCVHFLLDAEAGVQRILGRAKIEGRADDADESIIRRRMATFAEKTLPVIEAYQIEGTMTDLDADRDVEAVYADLKQLVANK